MVEIVEHVGNDEVVLQQTGKVVVAEEEKKTHKLRILLIDDNVVCLRVMSSQLRHWGFEVTPKREALEALDLLRRNRNAFDIVFTDVVRFDLNGFHLSEIIKHQFGIPVIMISAKDDQRYIEEGIRCGAAHYLVKPMQLEVLQPVCELVIRNVLDKKKNNNPADPLTLGPCYFPDGNENPNTKQSDDDNDDDDDNKKKKKKDGHVSSSSGESSSTVQKKPRVVWDDRLHQKFVEAVLRLDVEKAVPKKILEIMNEPNLTRENIASHLQKFRNVLRKGRERLCQGQSMNPREPLQHFLNPTIQPTPLAPGLTVNFGNFCSGQEMIMSSSTNFNQQRSLLSTGNHFSQHHHLHQQQLIKNMATTQSRNNNSSSLLKTSEPRKTFFMETEYPIIDHRNQKNMFDQEFGMQQLVVCPQVASLPYHESTSTSSSSSSRGNNIGGHHHHHQATRPPTNVQPFHATSGGDVVPYQARAPINVQPFQAAIGVGGGDVAPYQARATTNVQSFQDVFGVGGGDVVPYQDRAPTSVQSFQADVFGGGGDVVPHQARTPANVQPFQSSVGGAGDHVVPYQARLPTNVQPFQAASGGGGDVSPYEFRPPMNVQPFQAGGGGDAVVPYQTMPTNVQPSQVGGDGGYGTGSSADKGNKVHLSVGGNNNDGYLMLPSIISSNIVTNQASSSHPNTSVEESINNSIVPNQDTPTQQSYQPTDSIGGFMENSVVPYQAMPTQLPSQPSTTIGGSIDDSIVGNQVMYSQDNTSVEGSNVPYLSGPSQELSQPTDSIGEFFDNSFAPYQAWPTQEFSQPTDNIGGSIDFIVPYQALDTQNSSHLSGFIGGNSGENNDHLLPSINTMVLYQDEHTNQLAQEISSFGGNSGQVGYTQPHITDHSSSFSPLFLSPNENSYMQLLPTDNTNADPIQDTSFVGENINGYDHQMMNPLPAADSVAKVSSNNIDDLPDEEISFMINELSNYGTSPSIS